MVDRADEKFRVLVVEDEQQNRQVYGRLLRMLGCKVDYASNGGEAVDLMKRNDYGVVFMDVNMPQKDGLEATREIRAHESERHVPIVGVTGHAEEKECLAAGMDDYVRKPISLESIRSQVEKWKIEGAGDTLAPAT